MHRPGVGLGLSITSPTAYQTGVDVLRDRLEASELVNGGHFERWDWEANNLIMIPVAMTWNSLNVFLRNEMIVMDFTH